jgi:hypothetical protein
VDAPSVDRIVIGVDPGPTTGIVGLRYSPTGYLVNTPVVVQCSINAAWVVLDAVVRSASRNKHGATAPTVIAVEHFVVGSRSARLAGSVGAKVTRELVERIRGMANDDITVTTRAAGHVKPWAHDERLAAANLYRCTQGVSHARDAARHALFAACCDLHVPDPLAKKVRVGSS